MIKQAMIFAAGRGTRLGELTKVTPKPLIEVAGEKPLLRHLDSLKKVGMTRVVVNAHHLGDQVVAAVEAWKANNPQGMDVILSVEEELLETGGGLREALPYLDGKEPCLVLNGDVVWSSGFENVVRDLYDQYKPNMLSFLAVTPTENTKGFLPKANGDFFIDDENKLQRANKEAGEPAPYIFSGVSLVVPAATALPKYGKCYSISELWTDMAAYGALYGMPHDVDWVDMGSPEGMKCAEALINYEKSGEAEASKRTIDHDESEDYGHYGA